MKTSIHAQAVARAIEFPDVIEIQWQVIDETGVLPGESYQDHPLTWQQVKSRFSLDEGYARECEGRFADGKLVLLAQPSIVEGRWYAIGEYMPN
jgi:hypothetical protein